MGQRTKVLITVKTYPLPSKSHYELVCTGGVREDGSFIRLYPIDYRYRPYWQWYKKYQWIEVEVERYEKDPRPESYRPIGEIRTLGKELGTDRNWAERKRYVLAQGVQTMCALRAKPQQEKSLGIIRPKDVSDFKIEPATRDWKPKWKKLFQEQDLFGPDRKPLEKIPYKFSYAFTCHEPGCSGHKMMIEDWEIGELFRKMRAKFRDECVATEKVRQRFFDQVCGPNIDTHFYVGTVLSHGTWVILGAFWPKNIVAMAHRLCNRDV